MFVWGEPALSNRQRSEWMIWTVWMGKCKTLIERTRSSIPTFESRNTVYRHGRSMLTQTYLYSRTFGRLWLPASKYGHWCLYSVSRLSRLTNGFFLGACSALSGRFISVWLRLLSCEITHRCGASADSSHEESDFRSWWHLTNLAPLV